MKRKLAIKLLKLSRNQHFYIDQDLNIRNKRLWKLRRWLSNKAYRLHERLY